MNINMTTARDVQAAAELADINEETLLAECKATKADLESLDRKLKELEALSEPLYPCLISSRRLSFGCSSLGRRNECRTNSRAHAEGITGIGRNMAAERRLRESEMRKKRFGGSPIDSALENESWRPLMARGADHCQEQNAASYRQEPQRQGERQCSDHKAHKGQLGVVARCQMSRRLLN